jgi:hypothetical protein
MDILLDKDGKVSFVDGKLGVTTDMPSKVSQRLFIRLRSNKGYWFMDKTFGVDWIYSIFGKRKTKNIIDSTLQNEIYKDQYVLEIIHWKSSVTAQTYTCQFSVKISGLDEELVSIRLLANESGFIIEDSEGNSYQVA